MADYGSFGGSAEGEGFVRSRLRSPNLRSFNRFAWVALSFQIAVGAAGAALAYFTRDEGIAFLFSGVGGTFLLLIVWSSTLPEGCSGAPLAVSAAVHPTLVSLGVVASPAARSIYGVLGFFVLLAGVGILFTLPLYGVCVSARAALRVHYRGATQGLRPMAMDIAGSYFVASFFVLVLVMGGVHGLLKWNEADVLQMEYTPWCQQRHFETMGDPRRHPFDCDYGAWYEKLKGNAGTANATVYDRSEYDDEAGLVTDGLSLSFKGKPSLQPFELVPGGTAMPRLVTSYDQMSEIALSDRDEGAQEYVAALMGGLTLILTLLSSQVYLRVSMFAFADIMTFRVTVWEGLSIAVNVVLILTSVALAGIESSFLDDWVVPLMAFVFFLGTLFLVSLWAICRGVLRDNHKFLKDRDRLPSMPSSSSYGAPTSQTSMDATDDVNSSGAAGGDKSASAMPEGAPLITASDSVEDNDSGIHEDESHMDMKEMIRKKEKIIDDLVSAVARHEETIALLKRLVELKGGEHRPPNSVSQEAIYEL